MRRETALATRHRNASANHEVNQENGECLARVGKRLHLTTT